MKYFLFPGEIFFPQTQSDLWIFRLPLFPMNGSGAGCESGGAALARMRGCAPAPCVPPAGQVRRTAIAAGTILAAGPNFFYVLKAFAAPAHRVAEVLLQPLASGLVMIAAIHWLHGRAIQPVLQLLSAGALGLIAYAAAWLAFEIIMIDP